jgi:hypothetical protein
MPKAAKKSPAASKKTAASKKAKPAAKTAPKASSAPTAKPLVAQQPQSKQQAALEAGMFLQTTDAWSETYFDPNDLHFLERQLFG